LHEVEKNLKTCQKTKFIRVLEHGKLYTIFFEIDTQPQPNNRWKTTSK